MKLIYVLEVLSVLTMCRYKRCWSKEFDYEVCGNWKRFGSSCYMRAFHKVTRSEADMICRSHNAFLVEVDDELEQKFLENNLMNIFKPEGVWIGLINTSGLGWTWNGRKSVGNDSYKSWGYSEPNDFMNRGETCAEMRYWDGKWNDLICGYPTAYICEKEIIAKQSPTMGTDISKVDWSLLGHVITTTRVTGVMDCYERCQAIPQCLSFNYEHSTSGVKSCELNNSTRGLVAKHFITRNGFSYYD